MKATGIVRRIDELGRVVIPKEIRRTQRIRRGDPLEIFTTGDGEEKVTISVPSHCLHDSFFHLFLGQAATSTMFFNSILRQLFHEFRRQLIYQIIISRFLIIKRHLYQFGKIASIFPTPILDFIPIWKNHICYITSCIHNSSLLLILVQHSAAKITLFSRIHQEKSKKSASYQQITTKPALQ